MKIYKVESIDRLSDSATYQDEGYYVLAFDAHERAKRIMQDRRSKFEDVRAYVLEINVNEGGSDE